jgi:hypothetical protein
LCQLTGGSYSFIEQLAPALRGLAPAALINMPDAPQKSPFSRAILSSGDELTQSLPLLAF